MTEDILGRAKAQLAEGYTAINESVVRELITEVERLRSEIMQPVETFGTPELVAWIEDMHRLVVDYPEPERGQIPFVMEMGELLTRCMKSWAAAKDARIKELESIRDSGTATINRLVALQETRDNQIAEYQELCKRKDEQYAKLVKYSEKQDGRLVEERSLAIQQNPNRTREYSDEESLLAAHDQLLAEGKIGGGQVGY